METKRPTWLDVLNALVVPFLLASLGALLLVAHQREQVSTVENRRLAGWPELSWLGLRDGSYTRDIENYLADHFPFRERFVAAAFAMRERRGLRPDTRVYDEGVGGLEDSEQWAKGVEHDGGVGDGGAEVALVDADAGLDVFVAEAEAPAGGVATEDGGAPENGVAEAEGDAGVDLELADLEDVDIDAGPTSIHSGVLVHGGRGMMLFNGTDESAQVFARIINGYAAAFPKQTVHVVVTPTATPFYIPEDAKKQTASERANLEVLKAALSPRVHFADVYSALAPHAGESIFYKTDHHWTALGAYYGYTAFCASAGLRPVALDTMEKRSRPPTQGSLYRLTRDAALKDVTDPTDYYETTVPWKAVRFTGPHMRTPVRAKVIDDEGTGYLSFLGGDWGVMLVRTEATTGRRAMVVKNSFGNVFTPFLLPHYEALVVVDYRYTERSLAELVRLYRIDDIIVVVDTVTANFPMHQRRLREVVTGHEAAWREGRGPLPDGGVRVKL